MNTWPEVRVDFHNGSSDHKAMIIILSQVEKGAKPFRLYNSWLEDETFCEIVKEGLRKNTRGTGLFRLQHRLKEAKIRIKQWAATKGHSAKLVQEIKEKLDITSTALEKDPSSVHLQSKSVELRKDLKNLFLREETNL